MPDGVEIPGWAITAIAGVGAIIAAVIKLMRWADERFLPRTEYKSPECSVTECTKHFMPRPEIEMALEHRAKRMHEIATEVQALVLREAGLEKQMQQVAERQRWHGAILKAIAEKMGIDGIPLPPDE